MMQNFENCRTWNDAAGKPKDIIIAGNIVNIDYSFDALYWNDRLNEKLTFTATDRAGNKYEIYTNPERNLATAIPVKNPA